MQLNTTSTRFALKIMFIFTFDFERFHNKACDYHMTMIIYKPYEPLDQNDDQEKVKNHGLHPI